jgi:hypothetical protein
MFSIARIPWLGSSFIGIICFILHRKRLYLFATYNKTRVEHMTLNDKTFSAQLTRKDLVLQLKATGSQGGFLKAPKNGLMKREIEESITACVEVKLVDSKGIIFSGTSPNAGYELSSGAQQLFNRTCAKPG